MNSAVHAGEPHTANHLRADGHQLLSDQSGVIHTWLQPGELRQIKCRKPFKRFPLSHDASITRLKPGVNENFGLRLLMRSLRRLASGRSITARALLILASICVLAFAARANVFNVTNANDSGAGSLRQAILDANAHAGADTIFFSIGAGGAKTITLISELPLITDPVTIDATSQPAYAGKPIIELNGNAAVAAGLKIMGGSSTVEGLVIDRFTDSGIILFIKGNNTIVNNYIGVSANGLIDQGNGNSGISIEQGSSNNVIGGLSAGTRNVISGNEANGIQILSGNGNQMLNNYIGTDALGTTAIGNGSMGIRLFTAGNAIGSPLGSGRNLISGNGGAGVSLEGAGATGNAVQNNYVGVDVSGLVKLSNGDGIRVAGANNIVGGAFGGMMNLVSGNSGTGVAVGGIGNKVLANYIGVAANGSNKLGNGTGMVIVGSGHVIGGSGTGNLISGNDHDGIYGQDLSGISILGNLIGSDSSGGAALGNGGFGMRLANISGSTIGGPSQNERNVVCANDSGGVSIEGVNSSGNKITGNYVGTDKAGTIKLGNAFGIGVSGSNNVIGGSGAGDGNLILGNTNNGIGVVDATGTTIQGNLIGTNTAGTAGLGNGGYGIYLAKVTGTSIGGTPTALRNVISGNGGGITMQDPSSSGNLIQGNYIGVDTNGGLMGNKGGGVEVTGANNTIGGSAAGAGNIISGNAGNGVQLVDTSSNVVQGNLIGTNPAGTVAFGNEGYGVYMIKATGTTIGGTTTGLRNLISGNGGGITMQDPSSSGNLIQGNYIGVDTNGGLMGNKGGGVEVTGANNTIGGSAAGAGNIISGNGYGVQLLNASNNVLQGNLIGTNATGTSALGNKGYGVYMLDVTGTTIGGTTTAARNVISGNSRGLGIGGASSGNTVQGNFIGVDITGSVRIANLESGVELGGVNNLIGGTVPGAGNVISGNEFNGVILFGVAVNNNKIQGNIIGLNSAGTAAIANGAGVAIRDASNTLIGGTVPGARNIISGNFRAITIDGVGTGTIVQGNYIGTDITGTSALANSWDGIVIGAANNTIGGTVAGARNLISGNANGIRINGSVATGNLVQGNYIGTKANGTDFLPNVLIGIQINTAFDNTIGGTTPGAGNIVAGNSYAGVVIDAGTGNAILGNSIFGNARLGIELSGQDAIGLNENDPGDTDSGANWKQNYPLLTSVIASGGNTTIQGKLNSNPDKQFRIEFFANTSCDGSGFGEGQTFIGSTSVTTDGSGDAIINASLPLMPTGQFITATATSATNDTSEFSPCALVGGANPGALQFESTFFLAEEFLGTATITVTRTSGMTGAVSVNYATSNGSAISPDDYTPTSGTLNFADGEVVKTFTIPIVYDSLVNEGQEGVNLTLSNPTGGATLGSPGSSSLLINNSDPAYPGSTFSDVNIVEGDNGTTDAVFTITLSPHKDVVTVGYATVDGLATAPADYQATSGQLIFNPGENSKTVSVPVVGDTVKEGNEMFFLNLGLQSAGYTLKSQGEGMIIDDDGDSSFQFSQPSYSVNENGGAATVTVNRTGQTIKPVTVDYATVDDTATAPSDYGLTSGTLNFASGETSKTFTVNINDDTQSEGDEKVTLKLSNATAGAALASPSTAALTIVDNDAPPALVPALSITDVSLAEGINGVTQFTFTVSLSAASGQPVSVDYTTADNTAFAGSDYQGASGQLTFVPNEVSKSLSVMVNGDTQLEPAETFFVNLSNPANATISKGQGVGTIENDDAGPQGSLSFSAATYNVNENGGQVTITVKRLSGTNGAISVQYATVAGGSAAAGSDYIATAGTLSWADGDSKDKSFTVSIADDSTDETNETVNVALTNPTGGTALGSPASATLTIADDDPAPKVSIADVGLAEGNSSKTALTFTISLDAGSGQSISVNYATADNTALEATDYQAANGVVTFAPGETSRQVTVLVNGDTQVEPNETFFVNLSNPANATISRPQGVGTIENDDAGAQGSLAFSAATFSAGENDGQATITVKRVGGSNGAISVQYGTVAGGSAAAGSDYTAAAGTFSWSDGETKDKTFTVSIADDSTDETNETVNLALTNPTGGATLGSPANATLTIADDDPAPKVSIDDVSLAEGNSGTTSFAFTISLDAASGQTTSVNYITADNTALEASDYQAANGVVTFAPGETSKQVTVLINGDTQVEPNETFAVNLYNLSNASAGKVTGAGTIVNDDSTSSTPTIQFSQATYSVAEELGPLTVTVTRSGDTSGAAAVDYTTADGSATQKADFEYAAGTFNFAPGETSKTLTLLINEDMFGEGDETFNLVLSNPAGTTLGAQSTATVTIVDDVPDLFNPIDDPQSFVYTHYHDFLNREPDAAGLAFWTSKITTCGSDAKCLENARINVSASFFLSIEFQETAYLLYLMQKESYATMPKYMTFMRDLQEVSRGVVVNAPGWEQKLSDNQQQFAEKWINRAEFKAAYDALSNDAYVNALYKNAGIVAPQAEKDKLVAGLNTTSMNRSTVLLEVAGDATFRRQEQNGAFVLMEYFGYLRRDPQATPDSDLSGYNFWLNKLNQFNGNYIDAEMIKAFTTSFEYRQRFGQP
jgi:hypothetical protein